MPTLSQVRDLKFLADKDIRHHELSFTLTTWWMTRNLTLLIEYDTDGVPLLGAALAYPSICPIDPDADTRLEFWVANLDRPDKLTDKIYATNVLRMAVEMKKNASTKLWGFAPKHVIHLRSFIDKVIADGFGEKYDGDDITNQFEDLTKVDYRNHDFYIGEVAKWEVWMKGKI